MPLRLPRTAEPGTAEPDLAWHPHGRGPSPAVQGRDSADAALHVPRGRGPGLHPRAHQRFVDEPGGVDGVGLGRGSATRTGSREQRLPLAHVLSLVPAAAPGHGAAPGAWWLPGGSVDAAAVPLSANAHAPRPHCRTCAAGSRAAWSGPAPRPELCSGPTGNSSSWVESWPLRIHM